jgi:hypothetical protein
VNKQTVHTKLAAVAAGVFLAVAACSVAAAAGSAESVFSHDDQYILIEAGLVQGESSSQFGLEIGLTPKPGWKILVDNSSGSKPLRLKFSPGKCLKLKGKPRIPAPDLAGNDESGAYSEYFTGKATIRQDFTLSCGQKKGTEGIASLSYLLCQDNRCVGPFSREIRFRAPAGR